MEAFMLYVPQTMHRTTDNSLWLYIGSEHGLKAKKLDLVDENGKIRKVSFEKFHKEFRPIVDEWDKPQAGRSIVKGGGGFFGKASVIKETRPDVSLRKYIGMKEDEKQRLRMELVEPAVSKFLLLCKTIDSAKPDYNKERSVNINQCVEMPMPDGFRTYFWQRVEERVDERFGLFGQHQEGEKLSKWRDPNFARDRFYVVDGRLFHRNCHFDMSAVLVKHNSKDLHGAKRLIHWLQALSDHTPSQA
jgi:hypothetical protein